VSIRVPSSIAGAFGCRPTELSRMSRSERAPVAGRDRKTARSVAVSSVATAPFHGASMTVKQPLQAGSHRAPPAADSRMPG
jgi:hypothetical protein